MYINTGPNVRPAHRKLSRSSRLVTPGMADTRRKKPRGEIRIALRRLFSTTLIGQIHVDMRLSCPSNSPLLAIRHCVTGAFSSAPQTWS